ncbi:hypothetical protein [Bradyrhizobium sp. CCBAU 51745]|uniref:hypothetical protein n=1 Tax=Bradyrhizobium sp. CCBAU 51745 TaxID=1325099 RepID=UPI002305A119|nr:hypothetical protein [Bradyrhizobium sp. CCBAU 51745]
MASQKLLSSMDGGIQNENAGKIIFKIEDLHPFELRCSMICSRTVGLTIADD